jgi:hypothetical protein
MAQEKIKKLAKKAVWKMAEVMEYGVGELLPKSKAQKCRDKGGRIIKGECVLFDKVIKDKKSIKGPPSRVRTGRKKYSRPPKRSS